MRVLFIWEVKDKLRNYLLNHPLKSETMEFIFLTKDELDAATIERPEDIQVTVGWVTQRTFFDKLFQQLYIRQQEWIKQFLLLNLFVPITILRSATAMDIRILRHNTRLVCYSLCVVVYCYTTML